MKPCRWNDVGLCNMAQKPHLLLEELGSKLEYALLSRRYHRALAGVYLRVYCCFVP